MELLFLDGVLLRMVITTEIATIEGGASFDDLKKVPRKLDQRSGGIR